jgi:hypothetical protein
MFNSSLRRTRSSRHNIRILLRTRSSSRGWLDRRLSNRGLSSAQQLAEVDPAGIASGLEEGIRHIVLVVGRIGLEAGRMLAVDIEGLVGGTPG